MWSEKRKHNMKKNYLFYLIYFFFIFRVFHLITNSMKKSIFLEVIEKIKKDYVDEVNQSEMMDSAINGLWSLDPFLLI